MANIKYFPERGSRSAEQRAQKKPRTATIANTTSLLTPASTPSQPAPANTASQPASANVPLPPPLPDTTTSQPTTAEATLQPVPAHAILPLASAETTDNALGQEIQPPMGDAAIIEIGASSCQAQRKIGGQWQGVFRFQCGGGASSVGGADAIPTITAVRRGEEPLDMGDYARVRHGHDALRACKLDSGWVPFTYLKFAFMSKGTHSAITRAHALQEKEAHEIFKITLRDVATAFFKHLVNEVVGPEMKVRKVVVNITESWRNSDAQALMKCFQSSHPDIDFRGYDECRLSLIGCMSDADITTVVVDCGHSTMNVGVGRIESGWPKIDAIHTYDTEDGTGAQIINMAAESALRSINLRCQAESNQNVLEMSEFIDEFFKLEPQATYRAWFNIAQADWDSIIKASHDAAESVINTSIYLIGLILAKVRERIGKSDFQVLLTGRWLKYPPFKEKLKKMVQSEDPNTPVLEDQKGEMTAVGIGLKYVVDNPGIISAGKIPVSLWMINDRHDSTIDGTHERVMRVCTRGQDLQGRGSAQGEFSPSYPIPYRLESARGSAHTLDLSIYGTPPDVLDKGIITEKDKEGFAYASIHDVIEFGHYTKDLSYSTTSFCKTNETGQARINPGRTKKNVGKAISHVYVYIRMDVASIQIFAVYASDGHEIRELADTSFEQVFEKGKLRKNWLKHKNIDLNFEELRQIAREELLSRKSDDSAASIIQHKLSAGGEEQAKNMTVTNERASQPVSDTPGKLRGNPGEKTKKRRRAGSMVL